MTNDRTEPIARSSLHSDDGHANQSRVDHTIAWVRAVRQAVAAYDPWAPPGDGSGSRQPTVASNVCANIAQVHCLRPPGGLSVTHPCHFELRTSRVFGRAEG